MARAGKKYIKMDISMVNEFRYTISKIVQGEFSILKLKMGGVNDEKVYL